MDYDCERVIKKRKTEHAYLAGNFAPIQTEVPLTPCDYTGSIPDCLVGGEYVRNGGNPLKNDDLGREAHWFDGDGMLSGVLFRRMEFGVQPEFVNAFVLTDIYLSSASSPWLAKPLLPSIASLTNPLSSTFYILWRIVRSVLIVILSHLPGSQIAVKKISAANTGIYWHDGRALATCESGPPMRVLLPGLETVGWYNGRRAEGEPVTEDMSKLSKYGDDGMLGWMKEWTTAHPRVDFRTQELISFHSSFLPPYVRYSIVPDATISDASPMFNVPVYGIDSPKMTHDFGVSSKHTIILDLPLSMNGMNLMQNKPMLQFDSRGKSRYGVFPRYKPEDIRWFEEDVACSIFHTANTWDEIDPFTKETVAVNMLSCRMNSASIVFSAGNLETPAQALPINGADDVCQLYYHRFPLVTTTASTLNVISDSYPLSIIPFEFPSTSPRASMEYARYIYGCSLYEGTFSTGLGRNAKIDCLVKVDVPKLLAKAVGRQLKHDTPADCRSVAQILAENLEYDCISVFRLPQGFYAQEMSFVPRTPDGNEDDGYLLTYVFNENEGLEPVTGSALPDARSELWVIDAKRMKTVVAKIMLPQRVPYGLHGTWINEAQISKQRPVESLRQFIHPSSNDKENKKFDSESSTVTQALLRLIWNSWMCIRRGMESLLSE